MSSADKETLRREALALRAALSADIRDKAAKDFCARFLDEIKLDTSKIIAGYWPMRNELDVLPLLTALKMRGHVIGLPQIARQGAPMIFRAWQPGHIIKGLYGMMEPDEGCARITPDVLVVPMVAFDARRHRLGYGAGYYDRCFAAWRAEGRAFTTIGAAYQQQAFDAIPAEGHDVPMDIIVTDQKIYRRAGAA